LGTRWLSGTVRSVKRKADRTAISAQCPQRGARAPPCRFSTHLPLSSPAFASRFNLDSRFTAGRLFTALRIGRDYRNGARDDCEILLGACQSLRTYGGGRRRVESLDHLRTGKCRVASLRAGAGVNPASAGRPIEGSIVKTSSSDPRDCHPSPSRPKYECLGNDHDARTIGTMFGGISSLDALVVTSAR
jgi:hypothetical protein